MGCPAARGSRVVSDEGSGWQAEWPEVEGYLVGPSRIASLTWHVGFRWSMVFDHAIGDGNLTPEQVSWPGSGEGACRWFSGLHDPWRRQLEQRAAEELRSGKRTHWPFQHRPIADVVASVNLELAPGSATPVSCMQ
jgi:hypothetical protein